MTRFDEQANQDNILEEVRQLKLRVTQLEQANIQADTLDEIAPELGQIDFRAVDPTTGMVRAILSAISTQEEFGVPAYLLTRNANGDPTFYVDADTGDVYSDGDYLSVLNMWKDLGIKVDGGYVLALAYDATNGLIYLGGSFRRISGVACDYIAQYDMATGEISQVGSGLSSIVYALAVANDGTLYIGGSFVNAGGDANADKFCKWNGTAFSAVGIAFAGVAGNVYAIAIDQTTGRIYVGGSFVNVGDANGDYITSVLGTTYTSLSTGLSGDVYALLFASDGTLYVGGAFANAGGDANADLFCKWNGSTFSAVGTAFAGASTYVNALAEDQNGYIYIGGDFINVGDANGDRVVRWTGLAYESLGTPPSDFTSVTSLAVMGDFIYAGGNVTSGSYLRRFDTGVNTWDTPDGGLNGIVDALLSVDQSLYAGGRFTSDVNNEIPRNYFAKYGAVNLKIMLNDIIKRLFASSDTLAFPVFAALTNNQTRYAVPFYPTLLAVTNELAYIAPRDGYLKNLYVTTLTAQPAPAAMTITVRVAGADTAITTTIPAGAAANTFTDLTHIVFCPKGSAISIKIVNGATVVSSAQIGEMTLEFL